MKSTRTLPYIISALVFLLAVVTLVSLQYPGKILGKNGVVSMSSKTHGKPDIGGAFLLKDTDGNDVSDTDFADKWLLVYFGFSYCPDICPTGLESIGRAIDSLGTVGEKIQPIFITIDPERDTVEHLASYMTHFNPRIKALTGSREEVEKASKAYRVYYAKATHQKRDQGENYLMDHSAFTYLMNPKGEYVTHFAHGADPAQIAATLREHVE